MLGVSRDAQFARAHERMVKEKDLLAEADRAVFTEQARLEREAAALHACEEAAIEAEGLSGTLDPSRTLQGEQAAVENHREAAQRAVEAQRAQVAQAKRVVATAQERRDAADLAVASAAREVQLLSTVAGPVAARDRATAALLAAEERRAAQRQADNGARRAAQARAATAKQGEKEARQIDVALDESRRAKARLRASMAHIKARDKDLEAQHAAEQQRRLKAAMDLKASQDQVDARLRGANERARSRKAAEDAALREEFNRILADGGNPYEVRRRKAMEDKAQRDRAQLQARIATKAEHLAARLLQEEEDYERKKAAADAARASEKRALEDFSTRTRERRADEAMRSRTITGTALIDPNSRLGKLYPSDHTAVKTRAFGSGRMGRASDESPPGLVVTDMSSKHADVSFHDKYVPKAATAPAVSSAAKADPASTLVSVRTAAEQARLLGEAVDEAVEPELPGAWDRDAANDAAAEDVVASQGRGLSKLEEHYMARARARHRDNMIKPQVTCGKVFHGPAFRASPPVIEFRDFIAGETYTQTVTLTNISNSFNSVKVVDFSPELAPYLEVSYRRRGRMSAGTSVDVTVTFRPRVDADLEGGLPLLAETGPQAIPIVCSVRRALPALRTPTLDFGAVTLGAEHSLHVLVENKGAIPCTVSVEPMEPVATAAGEGDEAAFGYHALQPVLRAVIAAADPEMAVEERAAFAHGAALDLPPYGQGRLAVRFKPLRARREVQRLRLRYADDTGRSLGEAVVTMVGTGSVVPVSPESEVLDLLTVLEDSVYRQDVQLVNTARTAMNVTFKVPAALASCVEMIPTSIMAQPGNETRARLKISPTAETLQACIAAGLADGAKGEVAAPIVIHITGQPLPASFLLRFRVTSASITLDPPSVDFGPVAVGDSKAISVKIRSSSDLPCEFGFFSLPPELKVLPDDNVVGTLLPMETLERRIVYTPRAATPMRAVVRCSTTHARHVELPCVGRGVDTALQLSSTSLHFRATPFGGRAYLTLEASNVSKTSTHVFDLRPPAAGPFSVSPDVFALEPQGTIRVVVTFAPSRRGPAEVSPAENAPVADGAPPASEEAPATEADGSASGQSSAPVAEALDELDSAETFDAFLACSTAKPDSFADAAALAKDGASGPVMLPLVGHTRYVSLKGCGIAPLVFFEPSGEVTTDVDFGVACVGRKWRMAPCTSRVATHVLSRGAPQARGSQRMCSYSTAAARRWSCSRSLRT